VVFNEISWHVRGLLAISTLLFGRGMEWLAYRVMELADWIAPDDFHDGDDDDRQVPPTGGTGPA